MRFSVWPSFERPWPEVLTLARWAEANGVHGIWSADHYMPDTDDGPPDDGDAFECWTTIAALAASVERLQLGSLVSPSTVHHPAVLAKQATTADAIAGGRVVLGIGAGWQVNEHRAYGIHLPEPRERVDRFAEFLRILRGLLDDERTTFAGSHFSVEDAPLQPKGGGPTPVPILVGTSSRRMLGLTARYADAWNTWGAPERIRTVSAALDAACDAVGRDPAAIRRTAQALFVLSDDQRFVDRVVAASPERVVAGHADELRAAVDAYEAMGLDELIVPDFVLGRDAGQRLERYQQLWEEVFAPGRGPGHP